jgi:hypothetical protein
MKYKLIASICPAFLIALAISDVGKPRTSPGYPLWAGEIVVEIALVVMPIAVIAFWAGKADGKGR